jgi:hypothetical protein
MYQWVGSSKDVQHTSDPEPTPFMNKIYGNSATYRGSEDEQGTSVLQAW